MTPFLDIVKQVCREHAPMPDGSGFADGLICSVCVRVGDIATKYPEDWYPQRYPCTTVRMLTEAGDIGGAP